MPKHSEKSKIMSFFRLESIFILCFFCLFLLLLSVSFIQLNNIVRDENSKTLNSSLLSFEQEFNKKIDYYDKVINTIARSDTVTDYISQPDNPIFEAKVNEYINEFTVMQSAVYKSIDFYIYSDYDYGVKNFASARNVENEYWYIDFFAYDVSEKWICGYFVGDNVLIKIVKLFDTEQKETGILTVRINPKQVLLSASVLFENRDMIFSVALDGEIMYANSESFIYEILLSNSKMKEKLIVTADTRNNYMEKFGNITVCATSMREYRLIIGASIDTSVYPERYRAVKITMVCFVFLFSVFFILLLCYAYRFSKTVKQDIALAEYYSENSPFEKLPVTAGNVLGQVQREYNSLIKKIKKLRESLKNERRKRNNAEIKMFQSQLSPHFIYNVVNYFRMQAETEEKYDMADSIAKFGKLMRYYMINRDYMVFLSEELKTLEDFFDLEIMRFPGRIKYKIICPEELYNVKLPKSVLQPIIENSVKYALRTNKVLKVSVNIYSSDGCIFLSVRDNGRGVDGMTLQSLNSQFESAYYKDGTYDISTKIGLKNINQRIKLIYGGNYHLTVKSKENEFFEVIIKIPLEKTDNEDIYC